MEMVGAHLPEIGVQPGWNVQGIPEISLGIGWSLGKCLKKTAEQGNRWQNPRRQYVVF
jgi:hypothetical protein